MVLEETLESPLNSKKIKPVNTKGNQPSIFTGRTNAEAETPIPPDAKSQLTGKDPDAGKDKGRKRREEQRKRWVEGIIDSIDVNLSKPRRHWRTGEPGVLQSMGS